MTRASVSCQGGSMTDPNLPPAGWYDDGTGTATLRYWDGTQWTEHTSPATSETHAATDPSTPAEHTSPAAPAEPAETSALTDASTPDASATETSAPAATAPAYTAPEATAWTSPDATPTAGAPEYAQAYAQQHTQTPTLTQPYGQPGEPAASGKKPLHILGIIGLAVSGIGFVLACIPFTVLFAWIVLPIGLVLSIVALFMKGAKWAGITGLSIAVVGLIVAAIVSFVSFIVAVAELERGIDEFDSGSSLLEEELDDAFAPEVFGSREDPLAIGETITTDEFEVVINSVQLNATDQVLAADEYNEPPAEGEAYAIVNITVTYTGEDSSTDSMVGVDYVSADGVVKDDAYAYAWGIEPEFGMTELFSGGSVTSNLVLMLPADADGVLLVSPGFFDEAWVSLR